MPHKNLVKRKQYAKQYNLSHPRKPPTQEQKLLSRKRAQLYYIRRRKIIRAKQQAYYRTMTEEQRIRKNAQGKKTYKKYKAKILAQHKKWRSNNKDKWKIITRDYKRKNKVKFALWYKDYCKKKYRNDIHFNLAVRLRQRIRSAIKASGTKRSKNIATLIGCTLEELKKHIQKQFRDGMSWERLSEIHIDHIKPVSKFDLRDPIQALTCFHYSNLQPLWHHENLKKSNKYTEFS